MAWFSWRRGEPPPPPPDEDDGLYVPSAVETVMQAAQASQPVDVALLRARLADLLREVDQIPWSSARFLEWSRDFSELAWRQTDLAVQLLAEVGLGKHPTRVYTALRGLVDGSAAVGIELLATSEVRVEEFVRRLAMGMDIPIHEETPEESKQELERLDYNVLLALANQAKLSAEERMERLRVLQESQEMARRRGKW
jgi:hypothetical protein